MFSLTPRERRVFVFLAVLIFCGALMRLLNVKSDAAFIPGDKNQIQENFPINVNTANIDELTKIPGIGYVTAARMINYRTNNGLFNSADDLKKVKGIGDRKLEMMKGYIALDGE
jgi:competence protein ComEA